MLFSVCFHCIVFRKMPGQIKKYQVLVTFAGSVHSMGKGLSTREQVQFVLTGGKRRYYASKLYSVKKKGHQSYMLRFWLGHDYSSVRFPDTFLQHKLLIPPPPHTHMCKHRCHVNTHTLTRVQSLSHFHKMRHRIKAVRCEQALKGYVCTCGVRLHGSTRSN